MVPKSAPLQQINRGEEGADTANPHHPGSGSPHQTEDRRKSHETESTQTRIRIDCVPRGSRGPAPIPSKQRAHREAHPIKGIHNREELLERGIFGPPVAPHLSGGKGLRTRTRKGRDRSREERGHRGRRHPHHPARRERSGGREVCTLLSNSCRTWAGRRKTPQLHTLKGLQGHQDAPRYRGRRRRVLRRCIPEGATPSGERLAKYDSTSLPTFLLEKCCNRPWADARQPKPTLRGESARPAGYRAFPTTLPEM